MIPLWLALLVVVGLALLVAALVIPRLEPLWSFFQAWRQRGRWNRLGRRVRR